MTNNVFDPINILGKFFIEQPIPLRHFALKGFSHLPVNYYNILPKSIGYTRSGSCIIIEMHQFSVKQATLGKAGGEHILGHRVYSYKKKTISSCDSCSSLIHTLTNGGRPPVRKTENISKRSEQCRWNQPSCSPSGLGKVSLLGFHLGLTDKLDR